MSTQTCVDNILKAAEGSLSPDELAEILGQVEGRVRRRAREFPMESQRDRLLGVAKEMAAEEEIKAVIERVTRAKAVIAKRKRISFYEDRESEQVPLAEAVNALNVGSEKGFAGAGESVAAQTLGLEVELRGAMEAEFRRVEGLVKILKKRDKDFDLDLAKEIWRISDDSQPSTGNVHAEKAAKIIAKYQEASRKLLNDAGAWIRKMPGWIVRQSHDAATMLSEGYASWRSTITPLLDERTFDDVGSDAGDREKFLRGVYDNLVTGVHNTADADWLGGFKGPGSRAKKVSAERVLHFKDAASWYAYNEKFGTGSVLEAVSGGLDAAARNTALMRVWGPNPRAAFDADVRQLAERARDRGNEEEVKKLRHWTTDAFFRQIEGTANATGNPDSARFHANIRSLISWTKLGGVVLSAFPDLPTRASLLRHNGINYLEGLGNGLASLVANRSNQEREAILSAIGAGADDMIGDVFARHSLDASVSGKIAKGNRLFFTLALQRSWDNRMRGGLGAMLSSALARDRGKAFGALHKNLQRALRRFNIGEPEWNVLRRMDTTNFGDEHFMTADRLDNLEDSAFEPIIAARMAEREARARAELAARRQAIDKFTGRAAEWVNNRRVKLETKLQKARDQFAEIQRDAVARGQKVDKALTDRMDLLERRHDLAIWDADLTPAAMRSTTPGAANQGFERGIKVGEERGKIVRDIQAIEARLKKETADRVGKLDERGQRLAQYASEKDREFSDFVTQIETKKAAQLATLEGEEAGLPAKLQAMRDRETKYARRDLKTRLNSYFADEVRKSVTKPGPRERALATFGTAAGTPVGEAVRYIMQYKIFGIGFQTMHIMREFQRTGKIDAGGLATLILGTTALGYLSMTAKEMLKGRNPRTPDTPMEAAKVFFAAMAQGGGAGIYGDFLFGEANRFGGGLVATVGGPAVGTAEDIWQLKGKLQRFEDPSANLLQLGKNNFPFLNLFYARLALDQMFFYKIQEAMNPGFLRRMEKRVRDQNQQTFWLKPTSAVR